MIRITNSMDASAAAAVVPAPAVERKTVPPFVTSINEAVAEAAAPT